MHIIACIEDPVVIKKIFTHLEKVVSVETGLLPEGRAPPPVSMQRTGRQASGPVRLTLKSRLFNSSCDFAKAARLHGRRR